MFRVINIAFSDSQKVDEVTAVVAGDIYKLLDDPAIRTVSRLDGHATIAITEDAAVRLFRISERTSPRDGSMGAIYDGLSHAVYAFMYEAYDLAEEKERAGDAR